MGERTTSPGWCRASALDAARRAVNDPAAAGYNEHFVYGMLARVEAAHGDPGAALAACRSALRACAAAGDRASAVGPLSALSALLHRAGRDEPAAVIVGCFDRPALAAFPELAESVQHLHDTLGDAAFSPSPPAAP